MVARPPGVRSMRGSAPFKRVLFVVVLVVTQQTVYRQPGFDKPGFFTSIANACECSRKS